MNSISENVYILLVTLDKLKNLDKNIQIYDQRFALKKPNLKLKNYTQNYLVIEFKFNKEDKKFINDLDINIPIKVSRNSKYINGIRSVVGR